MGADRAGVGPARPPRPAPRADQSRASQLNGLIGSYTGPGPHYDVSYSGGTTTVNSNPPTDYSSSTSTNAPGAWGGGAYSYFTTSGGSINCAGPITAKFDWNGGPNSAPFPPAGSVVVTETANAYWSGPGSKGDCGLPNPTTPASSPPSQTATRYSVQGGQTFSVTATPTASASGVALSGNSPLSANAFVGYVAAASVTTMSVNGVPQDAGSTYNILVGQGCGVSVPALSPANTTYAWTVSGTRFQDWQGATPATGTAPANSQASYYVDGPGPLNQATAHWFWNDASQTSETVTCAATVTPSDGKTPPFTVNVTQKVSVQVPGWTADGTGGYMRVNTVPVGTSGALRLLAGPRPGQLGGINWTARSFTPQTPVAFGTGTVELVQTVTPNMSYVNFTGVGVPGSTHYDPLHGQTGLDTICPYPAPAYAEGSILLPPYSTNDTPSLPLSDTMASATMTHSFTDHLLYLPPGSDVRWVPLGTFTWSTNGNATNPGSWANYVAAYGSDSAGTVIPTATTVFTPEHTHPSWTQIITGAAETPPWP